MNISDRVLYKDDEYDIEAKTINGERFKITRNVTSKVLLWHVDKTVIHWVDRSEIQQIRTIVDDEQEQPIESVIRDYDTELRAKLREHEEVEGLSKILKGIEVFIKMMDEGWGYYKSDLSNPCHRMHHTSKQCIEAKSFKELLIKLTSRTQ